MANKTDLLKAALWYARRGWRVFPARPKDKRPMIKAWPKEATTDPAKIRSWWDQWPDANVAIATGGGLEVLDVDYDHGGAESMRQLRAVLDFPTTPTVHTAGGCHHYFSTGGTASRNKAGMLPGLDWRGEGGYVIAPPSVHPSGITYSWGVKP